MRILHYFLPGIEPFLCWLLVWLLVRPDHFSDEIRNAIRNVHFKYDFQVDRKNLLSKKKT